MGLFDRFRGIGTQLPVSPGPAGTAADDQAIARYRYLLRTAPPETIEQAHAEAFAKLTSEQRHRVLEHLSDAMPEAERAAAARAGYSPGQLARVATRAEIRQPGVLERTFGGLGAGGPGLGSLFAGTFLASVAGTVLGSMMAQHFFNAHPEGAHPFGNTADDTSPHSDEVAATGDDAIDGGGDLGSAFDGGDSWDV